ncbi:hypothetical protein HOY80DRAFT_994432 [Tuber brumale]|nr:hypothetical protein HOY80DRAFT_994432 [Tuber brumale]
MGKRKVKTRATRHPPRIITASGDKPPVLPPLSVGPPHLSTASLTLSSTSTSSPETTSTSASNSASTNTTTTTPPSRIPSPSTTAIPTGPAEEPPSTSASAKEDAEREAEGKGKETAEGEEGEGSCGKFTHSANPKPEWGDGAAPGEKHRKVSGGDAGQKRRGFWRRVFGRERDTKGKGVASM